MKRESIGNKKRIPGIEKVRMISMTTRNFETQNTPNMEEKHQI